MGFRSRHHNDAHNDSRNEDQITSSSEIGKMRTEEQASICQSEEIVNGTEDDNSKGIYYCTGENSEVLQTCLRDPRFKGSFIRSDYSTKEPLVKSKTAYSQIFVDNVPCNFIEMGHFLHQYSGMTLVFLLC